MAQLDGRRVAILVADGFEQVELVEPRKALDAAGAATTLVSPVPGQEATLGAGSTAALAATTLVSPVPGQVQGFNHDKPGDKLPVDRALSGTSAGDFDALLLPGGVANPDNLRVIPEAVAFVKAFFEAGKPVGAICHGPWTMIEADVVRGRTVTSWPSLQTDLRNAGATWVDQEVVTDKGLVTSRNPSDIPAFSAKLIEEFAEGKHPAQREKTLAAEGK